MMTDAEWAEEREAAAGRFFGTSAEEFARRVHRSEFSPEELDRVHRVLMLFPELD